MARDGFLDAPRPDISADLPPDADVTASVVAAPIRIPLVRLTELLEASVPVGYGDLSSRHALRGNDRTELAFRLRRGRFNVSMTDEVATVGTTVRYALRAFYDPPLLPEMSASCGTDGPEPEPRLRIAIRGPVRLDRRWRLRTGARVLDIAPATDTPRDRCTVTFLGVDVTETIVDAARGFMERHVDDLDSLAAQVDVRSSMEGWWATLQEPIRLTDSLWLVMRPGTVRRGAIRGYGDSLDVALALGARPSVHYGARPRLDPVPLPDLGEGDVTPALDLRVEGHVDYAAASGLLQTTLEDREIKHDGRVLRLDSLRVFGIGAGRLAVEVVVSGDVAARLFLVGTPRIDPVTAEISVPDLDFDVATRDVVLAAATWLRASELRELLRDHANWASTPAVEWITHWLMEGLNRDLSDDLRVEGDIRSVRILGVHARTDALVVRVAVGGTAQLFVHGDNP